MRRAARLTSAVCAATVLASVAAPTNAGDRPDPGQRLLERAAGGAYPGLSPTSALGRRNTDAGVGVYPALEEPEALTFPSPRAVEAARRWAGGRQGRIAFAAVDERGSVRGLNDTQAFPSASLSKAMLLVAFLRRAQRENRPPTEGELRSLGYMIRLSDNASAGTIYGRVGDEGMRELARAAGMTGFRISGDWADAQVTAADQARFFLGLGRLLPGRYAGVAYDLLSTVTPEHAWGIPAASRPRYRTWFKGGWRPDGNGALVHQGALLERDGRRSAIAVLTEANPGEPYGHATVRGLASILLSGGKAQTPRETYPAAVPGSLVPVGALRGYKPPQPRPLRPLGEATSRK